MLLLNNLLPFWVGHRTQVTGTLLVILNAYKALAGLFGLPAVPEQAEGYLNTILGGASLTFLAAKIDRSVGKTS